MRISISIPYETREKLFTKAFIAECDAANDNRTILEKCTAKAKAKAYRDCIAMLRLNDAYDKYRFDCKG